MANLVWKLLLQKCILAATLVVAVMTTRVAAILLRLLVATLRVFTVLSRLAPRSMRAGGALVSLSLHEALGEFGCFCICSWQALPVAFPAEVAGSFCKVPLCLPEQIEPVEYSLLRVQLHLLLVQMLPHLCVGEDRSRGVDEAALGATDPFVYLEFGLERGSTST